MSFVVIFFLLFLLELAYIRIAGRFNIVDKPDRYTSHKTIGLRGGGIIFLFGPWLYAAFFGLNYPWFILGLTLIGTVSFIDDVRSLPISIRLVVQFAAMALMLYQFGILSGHNWWIAMLALIICVGITNAYNFMDGINGITGAYSLAVLLPLIYLNHTLHFIAMPFLIVTALSVVVFCFFNFRKRAKCFAGDVGSISMAFIVIFALGMLIIKTQDLSYIIFLAVYGADAILTIIHRIMLHENLGQAHRKHAYQLMANELQMPHTVVASIYALLQLAISAGLIFLPLNHYLYLALVIPLLALGYLLFMRRHYHLHQHYLNTHP